MSFVEKHKAWLLPLLGLGVVAVAYLNYPSAKPAPAAEPVPPPVAPVAPAPVVTLPTGAPDLWKDLSALAKPPADLTQDADLRDRARSSLGPLLSEPAPFALHRPGRVREAEPDPAAAPPKPAKAAAQPPAPPEVEFLFSGPSGGTAWVHGHPYRVGEAIEGGPFKVSAIERARVGLLGPDGKLLFQTMQHKTGAGPRLRPDHAEAP